MGAFSRDKGARGEREVIGLLQPIVTEVYDSCGLEVPKLQRNSLQADGGGCDIVGLDWIAIEVKWHEKEHVWEWWEQTVRQAGRTKVPLLIYRGNTRAWKVKTLGRIGIGKGARTVPVIVRLPDFLDWFRAEALRFAEMD